MADAIALAQLNRITRAAVKLIKGIQIVDTEEYFEMAVFSVIAWFKAGSPPAVARTRWRSLCGRMSSCFAPRLACMPCKGL